MAYKDITPPAGDRVTIQNGKLQVPNHPILPFIRGDGTGPDIWAASQRVFDAAVQKAYGGSRKARMPGCSGGGSGSGKSASRLYQVLGMSAWVRSKRVCMGPVRFCSLIGRAKNIHDAGQVTLILERAQTSELDTDSAVRAGFYHVISAQMHSLVSTI